MRPTAPENVNGDAATDRLDRTWKAQVNPSQLGAYLTRLGTQVYSDRAMPLFCLIVTVSASV